MIFFDIIIILVAFGPVYIKMTRTLSLTELLDHGFSIAANNTDFFNKARHFYFIVIFFFTHQSKIIEWSFSYECNAFYILLV